MLADMYVSATLARSNCYYGAWALSTNASELPEAAAAARTGSSGRETDISLYIIDLKSEGVEVKALTNIDPTRGQAELSFRNCKA